MKKTALILFIFISLSAFCQKSLDTVHIKTVRVKKKFVPLKAVYSSSNTLYTNVANIVQICYPDSASGVYSISSDLTYIKQLSNGRFTITRHGPGKLTISIFKAKPDGASVLFTAQEFDVKPLPEGSLTIGGNIVDTTASKSDIEDKSELGIIFGDYYPSAFWSYIDSFDLRIDSVLYHSSNNKLTQQMLDKIKITNSPVIFENVIASIMSDEDKDEIKDKKGARKVVQKSYVFEKKSKPVMLLE
jgi:hypothetical protein